MTKHNLFPRLPEGPYMAGLRHALAERDQIASEPTESTT